MPSIVDKHLSGMLHSPRALYIMLCEYRAELSKHTVEDHWVIETAVCASCNKTNGVCNGIPGSNGTGFFGRQTKAPGPGQTAIGKPATCIVLASNGYTASHVAWACIISRNATYAARAPSPSSSLGGVITAVFLDICSYMDESQFLRCWG